MRNRAVVHVDLDGAAHIFRAHGWTPRGRNDPLFASGLRRILEVLNGRGIVATLFVIAEDLMQREKRELIVAAARQGHEIASHTMTHRHLTALPPEERDKELRDSRDALEQAMGVAVTGLRAPGFLMDRRTLAMAAAAGYRYDSSAFLGSRAPRGALAIGRDVEQLEHDAGLRELALPSYNGLPWPFHPSYSLLLGTRYFGAGLDRALRSSLQPLVLLMHLTDLADPLPATDLPGWQSHVYTLSVLSAATKQRRMSRMLDMLQARCDVVPTRTLLSDREAHAS
jgi:peptidoglycan/xylan/chitin deacetylase (PgdA/CDA1 family)